MTMRRLGDAVNLPAMLETIGHRRTAWRSERIATHGFSPDVTCAECGDTGHTPERPREWCWCATGRAGTDRDDRDADWTARMPRRVHAFRLTTALDRNAATAVYRWWLRDRRGDPPANLLLTGPAGVGKTGLAVGALHQEHHTGGSIAFVNVAEWVELMRPTNDELRRDEQDRTVRRCERAGLLVLDDLGAERATEWTTSKVYAVVNRRYDAALPTIVTTNMTTQAIADRYGDRVADRLTEHSVAVTMTGTNLRRSA